MPLVKFGEILKVDTAIRSPKDKASQIVTCHNKYSMEPTRLTIPSDVKVNPNTDIHTYYLYREDSNKKSENEQPIKLELHSRDENGNSICVELVNDNGHYREQSNEEKAKTEEGNLQIMNNILQNKIRDSYNSK